MIPSSATHMGFWQKFSELQYKMLFAGPDGVVNHMYSSEPLEWPLLAHSVAYWVNPDTGVSSAINVREINFTDLYIQKKTALSYENAGTAAFS